MFDWFSYLMGLGAGSLMNSSSDFNNKGNSDEESSDVFPRILIGILTGTMIAFLILAVPHGPSLKQIFNREDMPYEQVQPTIKDPNFERSNK